MICSVGLICVDIVNFMAAYPPEDADQRGAEQSWERGGNATNSATILALLGAEVEFVGTLADDKLLKFLEGEMDSLGIKHDNCPIINCKSGPVSVVLCSRATGTRTIVHANGDLPELSLTDFKKLNLSNYSWIHFEGRNEHVLPDMLKLVKQYNRENPFPPSTSSNPSHMPKYRRAKLPVSFEVELHIDNLDIILPLADVVFVGKDFARHHGARNGTEAAKLFTGKVEPGTVVVCPWGEQGASYCIVGSNLEQLEIKTQDAFKPAEILDSLGAGDTFNGVVIYCLKKGLDVATSVRYACRMASKKLEIRGMKGLKDSLQIIK